MRFIETALSGVFLIEPEPILDERGSFTRIFDQAEFARRGLRTDFPQWSVSRSRVAGTLRGLHYQKAPASEAKLLRCTAGAIYDVVVDLRPESSTYCRWLATELSAEGNRLLYVPEGVAHGLQTLVDETEVCYHISTEYRAELQAGVRWDDPHFAIDWPLAQRVISTRDSAYPDFIP